MEKVFPARIPIMTKDAYVYLKQANSPDGAPYDLAIVVTLQMIEEGLTFVVPYTDSPTIVRATRYGKSVLAEIDAATDGLPEEEKR